MLSKKDDYEIGQVLVCRQQTKLKGSGIFHVSYEYNIVKINGDEIGLRDASESKGEILMIPKGLAKSNSIHGYCRTCHSYQGSSIDGDIIIFDWSFIHVNRKWLYTAITRATNLSKVRFYNGSPE